MYLYFILFSNVLFLKYNVQNENEQKMKNGSDSGDDEYSDMALKVGSAENSDDSSMRQ